MDILKIAEEIQPAFWFQLFLTLAISGILGIAARRAIKRVQAFRSTPVWIRKLCDSFYTPSAWLIWGYGILLAIETVVDNIFVAIPTNAIATLRNIFLILTLTGIMGVLVRRLINHLKEARSAPVWIKTLCDSFYQPSAWLIWGYGILVSVEVTAGAASLSLPAELIAKARNIFFVLFASWIILNWRVKLERALKQRVSQTPSKAQDELLIMAVGRVFTIFIIVITGMIVLDIMGVQLTALLAFGGIGGLSVGFAAKDIVANFFGGFMIYINRHFTVGEWIMSPNKNFEGVVEDIGWYMTRIRTFARRPLFIPNAIFIDAIIENPGRMYNRRIKESVGIRYNDVSKLNAVVEAIRSMLRAHPEIDQTKTLLVHFTTFGPHSLDIEVYCFTKTTDWEKWRDIQQDVFIKIAEIIESHDAEIAFPTSTVHLQGNQSSAFEREPPEEALSY